MTLMTFVLRLTMRLALFAALPAIGLGYLAFALTGSHDLAELVGVISFGLGLMSGIADVHERGL